MRILILGRTDSIFTNELIRNLSNKKLKFEVLDVFHLTHNNEIIHSPRFIQKNKYLRLTIGFIYFYLYLIKLSQNKNYDFIHILYKKFQYLFIINILTKLSNNIIVSIFGSDFYKNHFKLFDNLIYTKVKHITFANSQTQNDFNKYYSNKFKRKTIICQFGLSNIETLKKYKKINKNTIKKQLNINLKSIVVTCGNNSSTNEQHELMISEISKISTKKKLVFIFPLTYGSENTRKEKIVNLAKQKLGKYQLIFLTEYLSSKKLSFYKKISDINLNMRQTDQLSGAMLEALYAENVVITGKWLPYQILNKNKISLLTITNISKLHSILNKVITNIKNYKLNIYSNQKKIYTLTSWQFLKSNWLKIYDI